MAKHSQTIRCFDVFIVLLTLKYFTFCSSVSITNFEHVIAAWDTAKIISYNRVNLMLKS